MNRFMAGAFVLVFMLPAVARAQQWEQRVSKDRNGPASIEEIQRQSLQTIKKQEAVRLQQCHHVMVDATGRAFRCEDDDIMMLKYSAEDVKHIARNNNPNLIHQEWRCSSNKHSLVPCNEDMIAEPPPCPLAETSLNQCEIDRNREIKRQENTVSP